MEKLIKLKLTNKRANYLLFESTAETFKSVAVFHCTDNTITFTLDHLTAPAEHEACLFPPPILISLSKPTAKNLVRPFK